MSCAFWARPPPREADLGEAQVAAANGVVTAEAKQSFERALKLDAADLKAQYFIGLAAEQDGRPEDAAQIWRTMLDKAPPNAPYRPLIQQSLARLERKRHWRRTESAAAGTKSGGHRGLPAD